MASAVQTKKKRDKRKRKEDGQEEFIPQPTIITPTLADDLNIHLHKEATTGGGLCAKLVFFVLLTVLSTLIGLIITEHRGLTDLDTINTESAFAHIFEGWIDKFPDPHDHEEVLSLEHSQEDEDGDDVQEHDNDDKESELSEETVSDEEKGEYDATQEEEEEEEEEQQDEEDDDEELETRETDSVTQEEGAPSDTAEDQETAEEVTNTEEKYEVSDSVASSKEDDPEIETARLLRPDAEEMKEEEHDEEPEPENDSKETVDSSEKESPEKIQEEDVDETVKESSNMVVRFGVGTALLVVAHVVLIKKWRSAKISVNRPEGDIQDVQGLDLTRRNTIVLPPDLDKIERDYEQTEEDYSEDEDCKTEEDRALDSSALRQEYQQLRSAYSHNLSPDWIPREMYNNSEEEEEDEDEPDEEECEEEEEEVDRSDEDDEIISESEDAELLRRLQERYGALHQDEDEEEELEDDEEYEEDGSTNYDHWKRKPFVPIEDTDSEDENSWTNRQSGGQTNYDFSNITNTHDWKIRDELDRAGHNLNNE